MGEITDMLIKAGVVVKDTKVLQYWPNFISEELRCLDVCVWLMHQGQ